MDKTTHPYFVPDGESRQETAVLLVGTAAEYGIPKREVAAVQGGFRISEQVNTALGYDDEVSAIQEAARQPDQRADARPTTDDVDSVVEAQGLDSDDPDADDFEDFDGIEDSDEAVDYGGWEYADLKAEVDRRGLETADRKTETYVAALHADDEANQTTDDDSVAGDTNES